MPDFEDKGEIEITIHPPLTEDPYGSKAKEKGQPLEPVIETVTSENWLQYFPDIPLTAQTKEELEDGRLYYRVALDPQSRERAGSAEVRHYNENALTVNVEKKYHWRGVASALIRQAQADNESLHLINYAGKAGENLYLKMGFKPEGFENHFTWAKSP